MEKERTIFRNNYRSSKTKHRRKKKQRGWRDFNVIFLDFYWSTHLGVCLCFFLFCLRKILIEYIVLCFDRIQFIKWWWSPWSLRIFSTKQSTSIQNAHQQTEKSIFVLNWELTIEYCAPLMCALFSIITRSFECLCSLYIVILCGALIIFDFHWSNYYCMCDDAVL